MSSQDYFQLYIDILCDTFRRIRKANFKKFHLVKDLIDTVESTPSLTQTSSANKSTAAFSLPTTSWP